MQTPCIYFADVSSIATGVSLSVVVCLVILGTAAGVLTVIATKRKTGRCKTDSSTVTAFSKPYYIILIIQILLELFNKDIQIGKDTEYNKLLVE